MVQSVQNIKKISTLYSSIGTQGYTVSFSYIKKTTNRNKWFIWGDLIVTLLLLTLLLLVPSFRGKLNKPFHLKNVSSLTHKLLL